jgi:hypothetical protein
MIHEPSPKRKNPKIISQIQMGSGFKAGLINCLTNFAIA